MNHTNLARPALAELEREHRCRRCGVEFSGPGGQVLCADCTAEDAPRSQQ